MSAYAKGSRFSTSTALARLALALSLALSLAGCNLLSRKQAAPAVRVVCAPSAKDACDVTSWVLPAELNADQAGELALSARAELVACSVRHEALRDCVGKHNGSD